MLAKVIAIGPQGGKIVGYTSNHKPVYLDTSEAEAWHGDEKVGSPMFAAALAGLDVRVHATRTDMVQVSWPDSSKATAKAWLQGLGGTTALPMGSEAHGTSQGKVLLVPRTWAEGAHGAAHTPAPAPKAPAPSPAPPPAAVEPPKAAKTPAKPKGPKAVTPESVGLAAVDKHSLPVWGVKHWLESSLHPVTTPDGPGMLVGHECYPETETRTGKLAVQVGGVVKFYAGHSVKTTSSELRGVWMGDVKSKVWKSPKVDAMFGQILEGQIKSSDGKTYADALKAVEKAGHAAFVGGGMVRDAVQGESGNDVDFNFTCSQAEMIKIAKGAGIHVAYVSEKSGLVELGHQDASDDIGKMQGKQFSGGGAGYNMQAGKPKVRGSSPVHDTVNRDFTCNCLFYDPKNKTIIDPTGRGVDDALNKRLTIPVGADKWDDWAESQPGNAIRYWKFRARGYVPDDAKTEKFIKTKCAKLIEGGKYPSKMLTDIKSWPYDKKKKFKAACVADMGETWWDKHMATGAGI